LAHAARVGNTHFIEMHLCLATRHAGASYMRNVLDDPQPVAKGLARGLKSRVPSQMIFPLPGFEPGLDCGLGTRVVPRPRDQHDAVNGKGRVSGPFWSSGGGIRTRDLRVMSPTSYQTAPPRVGDSEFTVPLADLNLDGCPTRMLSFRAP
jgi:hypothetical protein